MKNPSLCAVENGGTIYNVKNNMLYIKKVQKQILAEGTIFEPFCRKRPSTIVPETVER